MHELTTLFEVINAFNTATPLKHIYQLKSFYIYHERERERERERESISMDQLAIFNFLKKIIQ